MIFKINFLFVLEQIETSRNSINIIYLLNNIHCFRLFSRIGRVFAKTKLRRTRSVHWAEKQRLVNVLCNLKKKSQCLLSQNSMESRCSKWISKCENHTICKPKLHTQRDGSLHGS